MRAPEAPLETIADNLSPLEAPEASPRAQKRRDRWEKRAILWRISDLRRLRHCGRSARSTAAGVTVREREGMAGFAGLQSCGSPWACPVCASKILTHRALEVGAVLGQAVAEGHSLGFCTFTMRHRKSQGLASLWDAAGSAWQRAVSGKKWVAVRDGSGVVGWVRVWEVTDGRNGWHVHVHFVVVLGAAASNEDLERVAGGMFRRWAAGLVAAGLEVPLRRGQDWHLVNGDRAADELAGYLCKIVEQGDSDRALSLGLELTHSLPGRAKSALATRPVWSLLERLVATGEVEAVERWHEWERASKGRRQIGWSRDLRPRFELTDDQVAEREMGTADDDLVMISNAGWRQLVRTPHVLPLLLEAAEARGLAGLRALLDSEGVAYSVAVP